MKTKPGKNKINIITLGCSKNAYDSEVLMGQLKANNISFDIEAENGSSPIVVINTCGFIDRAKAESINTILQYAEMKKKGIVDKVYVTGCLSERYKKELEDEIPDIDEYFGTHDLVKLLRVLNADYKHDLLGDRVLTTPYHYAYFKISEGCDRPCSFCAIPLMRGKHESIPMESLIKQAKSLASNGTKELILIAQDLTYYGLDIDKKRNLSKLLKKLSDVEGIEWIRLHYAFPSGFPMEVLDVIRENDKVCKYLDIPLQHINDRILKSMLRGITKKKTNEMIETIREKVPGIAIRTTLMTGYPGETMAEFNEIKEWVKESKFERLGVFTYSHEENTKAYGLIDDVPSEIKTERCDEIMQMQSKISLEFNQKLIGKIIKVIIDGTDGENVIGRTEFDSPEVDNQVIVDIKDNKVCIGEFVHVRIKKVSEYDLWGEVI